MIHSHIWLDMVIWGIKWDYSGKTILLRLSIDWFKGYWKPYFSPHEIDINWLKLHVNCPLNQSIDTLMQHLWYYIRNPFIYTLNIHSNIRTELMFHTTSGALWSGPPCTYLNVVMVPLFDNKYLPRMYSGTMWYEYLFSWGYTSFNPRWKLKSCATLEDKETCHWHTAFADFQWESLPHARICWHWLSD